MMHVSSSKPPERPETHAMMNTTQGKHEETLTLVRNKDMVLVQCCLLFVGINS